MKNLCGLSLVSLLLAVVAVVAAVLVGLKWLGSSQETFRQVQAQEDRNKTIISACHDAVKYSAKFTSKVTFTETNQVTDEETGNILVLGVVDLMNGLGNMIPHNYMCTIDPTTSTLLEDPFLMVEGSTPADLLREVTRERR